MLIGSDVSALFPSLTRNNTAAAVRRQTEKADIRWENLDTKWLRLYVYLNKHRLKDIKKVQHLLPKKRPGRRGVEPGIGYFECQRRYLTDEYKKGNKLVKSAWIWPNKEPNQEELSTLVA